MNTRHSRKISRKTAGQLLDGQHVPPGTPGPGTPAGAGQLASLLAAAAAPGREDELAGEQMAVAAFEANHLASIASSRREQMIKHPLAKFLTIKAIAAFLVVGATGGVALAASTGTFAGSDPRPAPSTTNVAAPAAQMPDQAQPATPAPATASTSDPGSAANAAPQPSSAAASTSQPSIPQSATALCQALAGDAAGTGQSLTTAAEQQALANGTVSKVLQSPEFSSLTSTAQSAAAVPDYCALLLDLPQLPQPAELTQLPVTVLAPVLAQVPAATLAQELTSLPGATLSALLAELPASTVTQILTELPSSAVSQILTALPASTLTQVLTELPKSVQSQVLNELPTSVVSQLVGELPSSVLSGLAGLPGLSGSVLSQLPGL